eukprot:gnl/MRDRNA2_/MRDRNA2_132170_c0_seq1.p1 gnl/MRDRNA2_/MRDRNA2_132170_c0~~gnl/MRDRNA2_/MRDRNA2_132170_c0_seq1.p1  ORF type:complete len:320 (-),score=65.64 gnl/MRDRNA2_/MRDRNA2_132170_c0_seq1:4-963(-)
MGIDEELKQRCPHLNRKSVFQEARAIIRQQGPEVLRQHLLAAGIVGDDGLLTTGTKPFNVFARVAAGVMSQPGMEVEQDALGKYKQWYVVACNRPENDEHWESSDPEWVGKASMSKRHRFLTTKDLRWRWFNALAFGLEDLQEAIQELRNMRDACVEYSRNLDWPGPLGLYVHVFPHNSVPSLHIHMVDLSCAGPTFANLAYKNLPLESVLEVLVEEQNAAAAPGFGFSPPSRIGGAIGDAGKGSGGTLEHLTAIVSQLRENHAEMQALLKGVQEQRDSIRQRRHAKLQEANRQLETIRSHLKGLTQAMPSGPSAGAHV